MRMFYRYTHATSNKKLIGSLLLFVALFVLMTFHTKAQVQLQSFSPTTNDVAPVSPVYTLEFDRDVALTTSTTPRLTLYYQSDGSQRSYYSRENSGFFSISGSTVTIDLGSTNSLESNTGYYFLLDAGLFVDATNSSVGNSPITSSTFWTFSTRANDGVAPQVVNLTPDAGATKVGPSTEISITFDEPVSFTLLSNVANCYIGRSSTTSKIQVSPTLSADRRTITLASNLTLSKGIDYWIILNEFTSNNSTLPVIRDDDGNSFAGFATDTEWRFSSYEDPVFTNKFPADDATNVDPATTVSFTLNNDIDAAASAGLVRLYTYDDNAIFAQADITTANGVTINGNQMTMDFGYLAPNTRYFVRLPFTSSEGVIDEFGVKISEPTQIFQKDMWDFTTGASTNNAPTDITLSPNSITEGNAVFDVVGLLSSTDADATDTHMYQFVTGTGDTDNNYFTIKNGNELQAFAVFDHSIQQTYSVRIQSFDGKDGYFEKALTINILPNNNDTTPPVITNYSPSNGETNANETLTFVILNFNEPVFSGGSGATFNLTNTTKNSVEQIIAANSSQVTGWGTQQITINFNASYPGLTEGDTYAPYTLGGFFQDAAGNAMNIAAGSYTFTVNDPSSSVSLQSLYPADGASGLSYYPWQLELEFDRPMQQTTSNNGSIEIYQYDNDQLLADRSNFAFITFDGNKVFIRSNSAFPKNTEVYVLIDAGVFEDANGNAFAGFQSKDDWNFSVTWDDLERVAFTPESFSNGFPQANGELRLQYNRDISLYGFFNPTFKIREYDQANGFPFVDQITFDDPRVSVDGDELVVQLTNLAVPLKYNTSYFVVVPFGFVADANNVPNPGYNNTSTWRFRTEPDPALFAQVISKTPTHQATNVSVDTDISITFDQPIGSGSGNVTINSSNSAVLRIKNRSNDAFITTIPANQGVVNGNTVIYTLPNPLPYNTEVAIQTFNQPFFSEDYSVIEIADNDTWYFTTEAEPDTQAPSVSSTNPADNAVDVSANLSALTITFDEPIQLGSGRVSIKRVSDDLEHQDASATATGFLEVNGNTLTINQFNPFLYSTEWYVNIDAGVVQDLSGNAFSGITDNSTWTFTTEAQPIAPNAPTNLSLSVMSSTRIDVIFQDNATDENGFVLERTELDSNGDPVADNSPTAPNPVTINLPANSGAGNVIYQDTGLKAGTRYSYRVRAFKN